MQSVSPRLSATTVPSASSKSSAVRMRPAPTSSSSSANGTRSVVGSPQCPSSIASVSAYEIPARTRIMAVFSTPSFMAMASAVLKANATNVARQAVRVFRHDLHGVGTVGLKDAHRPRRADAVAVQEDHDLADDLLFGPGIGDALGTYQANASHLAQALGLRLDRVEHLLAESAHELFRIDWTNAADHPGAEVFLDAVD